jgi:hypothetical protein
MDESVAYLLEEKNDENIITIIEAEDEAQPVQEDTNSPAQRRRKKNHAFFKKVFEAVKDFDKVLLFGPVSARMEILNRIRASKLSHIEILNKSAGDIITENQKIEFINQYFGN